MSKELFEKFRNGIENQNLLFTEDMNLGVANNLLDGITIESGFIDTSGQNNGTDTNWNRTDFIPVTENQTIRIKMYGHTAVNFYSLYDASKTFVSGYHALVTNTLEEKIFIVPSGVSYIRFSYYSESGVTFAEQYYAIAQDVKEITNSIKTIYDFMKSNSLNYSYNLLRSKELLTGYIGTDGVTITIDANWNYIDYVSVSEGQSINVINLGHPAINSYSLYNSSKAFVSGDQASGSLVGFRETVVIPSGVSYMRCSFANEDYAIANGKTYISEANLQSNIATDIPDIKDLIISIVDKQQKNIIVPHKIYTVANNIVSASKGYNRNYSAAIYLDHLFDGLTEENDIKFAETKSDRVTFNSDIHVTDSSYNVTYNVDGSTVKTVDRDLVVTGNDIADIQFTVSHISTIASANNTVKPRVLCIGDSITYGELAYFPNDSEAIQSFSLLTKQLFEMDKIDNGDVPGEYEAILLGIFKRTLDISYSGEDRTITACHQGIPGATIDQYIDGTVSYFWNGSRFSLKTWIDLYRTMDDTGTRLSSGNPALGSAVSDPTAYDVCVPTHIVIMLGANGSETGSQYVTKIQSIIDAIKLDCTTYGWTEIFISVVLADCAGTYFPSRHISFDNSIAIWNDTGSQPSRHSRLYTYMKQWLADKLATDTEVADKVFMLPFWWVMPTAESACLREIPLPEQNKNFFFDNAKIYNKYGWYPTTHLNPNAHWSFAYQLYSWVKYTLTL